MHGAVPGPFNRLREANQSDLWAMTEADLAVYDAAFLKLDKDKDGFVSPHGKRL